MKIAILGGHYLKNLCQTENIWSYNLPLSIDPAADNSVQKLLAEQCPFTPDLLLFADQGCLPMLTGMEDLEIPVAAYLIDTHLNFSWHRHFAGLFDQVFAAQQDAALSLQRHHQNCRWLPLFSRAGDLKLETEKLHDVVFVGTVDPRRNSERVRFLEAFAQRVPLLVTSGDYREPFNSARIILNQSVRNDINFRVFEALATGSLLLTDDVGNGLFELFEDGRHLVTYRKGDVDDAVAKARYYLDHPEERERIAADGHALVIVKHTLHVRSNELLCDMQKLQCHLDSLTVSIKENRRFIRKLSAGRTYLAIAMLMADLEAEHGNGYYGQRIGWYLSLADTALQQALTMQTCSEEIIRDLALLAFMQGDNGKAAAYCRIALADATEDFDLLLLASRIACNQTEFAIAEKFHDKALKSAEQTLQVSRDLLAGELMQAQLYSVQAGLHR